MTNNNELQLKGCDIYMFWWIAAAVVWLISAA